MGEERSDEEQAGRPIVSQGRLRKRRKDGWSRRDERVFFRHFRATCNVSQSARAAGKSPSSAYDLRARDPVFAATWDKELREGAARLHSKLILFAETKGKPVEPDEDGEPGEPDMADFDAELALKLLKFHQDGLAGGRRGRPQPVPASPEEVAAAILRGLDALALRLKKKRA